MNPMRAVVPEPNATTAHAPRSPSIPVDALPMKIGACQLVQPVGPVPDEHWIAYWVVFAHPAQSLPTLSSAIVNSLITTPLEASVTGKPDRSWKLGAE